MITVDRGSTSTISFFENDFYELDVEILDHMLITKYSKAVVHVSHKYKWNNPSFYSCEVMGYSIRLYL